MIAAVGDAVAYERQAGHPPVRAVVVYAHANGDVTVRAVSLAGQNGSIVWDFTSGSFAPEFRLQPSQIFPC